MEFYIFALAILFLIAIIDLIVGVSNDAVNFLNSAVGSRVAPNYVIMIVASIGILAGVTFSSGMMEVARKGIFHPKFFTMPELITIFLAVMLTDILLLDLFNTFGLPTSTTVSIVFELLGGAIAVSIVKILNQGESYALLGEYINTGKALAIISGILLSVGIAFACGVIVQLISRLIFTFDYEKRLKRYGGIWGGLSLSFITYFILIKGANGASFMTPSMLSWIATHTFTLLGISFAIFAIIFQILLLFTRINILKPIVLIGTFALAMAFAANDLVNFIGVPLAGFHAFNLVNGEPEFFRIPMAGLQKSVPTNTLFLLFAGAVMVATLWLSKKARTVTHTSVSLGRQDEGVERFDSSQISRIIVRMATRTIQILQTIIPQSVQAWLKKRIDITANRPIQTFDGSQPEFDLIRASVNLIVASALVAFATSMKLPLSTTYVTFMVAMGASLADRAWGLESAVYRVTGVLMVVGGWFFTALMAFSVSLIFAFAIHYLNGVAIFGLLIIAGLSIFKNLKIHGSREKAAKELELLDLKEITDANYAVRICFEHSGQFLNMVSTYFSACFDGILKKKRRDLKALRKNTSKIQNWSNTIVANIFRTLRQLEHEDMKHVGKYAYVISALQEIAESMRDLILRCHVHTSNQHAGLLPAQKKELREVGRCLNGLLVEASRILLERKTFEHRKVAAHYIQLKQNLEEYDANQIQRIRNGESPTRLSILFYGISNASLKIGDQVLQLVTIFQEIFQNKAEKKE